MSGMASPPRQDGSTRDEVHEDLVNEMWSGYLKNVDEYDKRVTDGWKEDANGVLVFTGLFSATVASFIIESYKLLSPDSGNQTVFLLGQLSQQFAGYVNGTHVQPEAYPMHVAVETAPTLLHLSVFLFYIGLVVFFFTIFKTVAIAILIAVGIFGMAYFTLTILPCLDHSCPYRTPMSRLWWYLWHTSLSYVARCLGVLLRQLHNYLVPYNLGDITPLRQHILHKCLQTIDVFAEKHGKRLKDGFRRTLVESALKASQEIDVKALTWLFQLPALTEKSKIQKFVASIPGETIIQFLSNSVDHTKITFRHHLSTLFRSCAPGTVGLTEEMRKRRLFVCLNAVHQVARASVHDSPDSPLLNDMRLRFAKIDLMRPLWTDNDPAIRVTARSICALFARQLLRKPHLEAGGLSWLQEVMDRQSSTIFNDRSNLSTVDSMNVDSFVNGVLSYQMDDLPNVQEASFKETLEVLMKTNSRASLHNDTFEEWLPTLIRRVQQEDGYRNRDTVVENLRRMSSDTTGGPQSQASGT
ncbi:hypothetical protein DFH94DRAFT_695460 [Russula ochroleuca]|uniref:DUF6535 domain-containing protein n=1 Tax=Russula ochroleuca TaxID=152965 RepID=A0A9P5K0I2_9AGAM|nr:hypothetical protein DFH94DRAFT_695460 [Russula ochroleuca]